MTASAAPLAAELVQRIRARPVTGSDLAQAASLTLDAVANMVAGIASPQGKALGRFAVHRPLDRAREAFLLGALCHMLEMDDLHRASVVHPGAPVVPAILALGKRGSGRAALTGLLHGFEAACRTGMAAGPAHYRIWHNTATCGPFGSAMAAAHLLGLDDTAATGALGQAGTQAGGLWEFNSTGADSKPLHAGRAAEAGVIAAEFGAAGLSGAPAIYEGPRGFFRAMCPDAKPDRLLPAPDDPWQAHATSVKPWPSCRHTHPAIGAALAISASGIAADKIISIDVTAYQAALDLCDRPDPASVSDAKFSLQHCVAVALLTGKVDFGTFEPPARAAAQPLARRVRVQAGALHQEAYPARWGSTLTLTLADGSTRREIATAAKGDPEAPLAAVELRAKALMLMAHGGLSGSAADRLCDQCLAMAEDGPVPDLVGLLASLNWPQAG